MSTFRAACPELPTLTAGRSSANLQLRRATEALVRTSEPFAVSASRLAGMAAFVRDQDSTPRLAAHSGAASEWAGVSGVAGPHGCTSSGG